ncbi:MAG: hypothetical protein WBB29_17910 [Geitlerinemataceae cyanobacterium]
MGCPVIAITQQSWRADKVVIFGNDNVSGEEGDDTIFAGKDDDVAIAILGPIFF